MGLRGQVALEDAVGWGVQEEVWQETERHSQDKGRNLPMGGPGCSGALKKGTRVQWLGTGSARQTCPPKTPIFRPPALGTPNCSSLNLGS